ncbi:MAG: ectoine/hydroxyectoine ABC transporter permease subunit EhuC [Bifidobacterium subtile]|jgi:polar amino acid transport system permease protein|nr:ectoine/hydroxyectoine ABC transporter permease subunit EhuC [Bifidobacterium subtile]MCI1257801.1 ectoine/hydroxyectoine ABC transporter permease subunit EhuC [Bifidobacterium subtile]
MAELLAKYGNLFLSGAAVTAQVTLYGVIFATIIAFVMGLARESSHRILSIPSAVFIEVFRGTSLIVQMFWLFYVLPFFGINLAPITSAVIALGCNEGAYAAEAIRGAIKAVPKEQEEASIALSLSPTRMLWKIKLPQALLIMLPSYGNMVMDLFKNTSLVSLVTVIDLSFVGEQVRGVTGKTFDIYLILLVMYFIGSLILGQIVRGVERFAARRFGVRKTKHTALNKKIEVLP